MYNLRLKVVRTYQTVEILFTSLKVGTSSEDYLLETFVSVIRRKPLPQYTGRIRFTENVGGVVPSGQVPSTREDRKSAGLTYP